MNNNDLMRQVAAALFVERMRHAGVHRVETDADDVQPAGVCEGHMVAK